MHILLAFDGPNWQELVAIDDALPQLFDEQTSGLGYLAGCNDVASFVYRGTGSAAQPYETTASMLDKAAVYLADTDSMFHVG